MGKKRIVTKAGDQTSSELKSRALSKTPKRRAGAGRFFIRSTYNNTMITLADENGGALAWSSSGSLGFKGAKKGTPFAASKVAELLSEKALGMGMKEVTVVVRGVGAGRESSIRTIASKGLEITSIEDATPIPHNGPRPPKARRV